MNESYTTCMHSKISVVIPIYCRHAELSDLLDSILRQTINPVEVIVIDDHTPNNTLKIVCKEYKSKFEKKNTDLKYVRNSRHQSAAVARNVGVENASGDIILFLDSDMIIYEEFIEKILDVFKDNSNALGVQGWIINKIEYNKIIYFIFLLLAKIFYISHHSKNSCKFNEYPIILSKIINCEWMSGGNMALKRNILNEYRFDENLTKFSAHEDILLSHSIFQKHPDSLFITPYARSIHKHSKTGRMEDEELEEHINWCIKYCLKKLFGFRGLLIYYWQSIGKSIVRICKRYLL